jgi:hypothetical protein
MAILMGGDQWMYRDPQGNMQGPFTKQDLIDWFEAGFFPQVLPPAAVKNTLIMRQYYVAAPIIL